MTEPVRVAVLTVSDGVTNGTREDASGDLAEELLRAAGFDVATRTITPDEQPLIEAALRQLASSHVVVVSTGGTGFGPRDVTPEATRAVIDREAPGLAELMRAEGLAHTPMAALSRAVAGTVGAALVINLPGSPKAVREGLKAILPLVPHAVALMGGQMGAHPTGHGASQPAESQGSAAAQPGGTVTITAVKQIGAPPCPVGARIVLGAGGPLEGTLGCAEFDTAALETAIQVLASGEGPGTRTFHHDLGDLEVFVEPVLVPPSLVVISANAVATALLELGRRLGYRTTLVEPRTERVTSAHRAGADAVSASLADVRLDARTDVVLTDHDAPGVTEAIALLLGSPSRFVGVMGSRRHVAPFVEELRTMGFGDADLSRVRSPVGIDLGARTPEEIALSIVAGLVAARAGRDGGWLDR